MHAARSAPWRISQSRPQVMTKRRLARLFSISFSVDGPTWSRGTHIGPMGPGAQRSKDHVSFNNITILSFGPRVPCPSPPPRFPQSQTPIQNRELESSTTRPLRGQMGPTCATSSLAHSFVNSRSVVYFHIFRRIRSVVFVPSYLSCTATFVCNPKRVFGDFYFIRFSIFFCKC